ncbi:aspartate/glutamate racemase family protein [Conservatibacter flavescens]|uniref:Aspartate/glutamate racemase n=1 Tax=Conservatibacter flavescens TaxID=28161 RepID=A0A2M8S199_9PAST|nr:aspartate/glutamate racemase family protein [Conservatibacter flavescens]PJG84932.1 aspartate/glutamate racemase [Conservatibacter flavescens]
MKTLGILAGMSPESSATYYLEINRLINQALGGNSSAQLIMLSVNFEEIVQCQRAGDWLKAGEILATAAKKLEDFGAEGIVLATNTMHKVAPQIKSAIRVPFLSVIDVTAEVIHGKQIKKVALLGTKFTMSDTFYREALEAHGIEVIVPNEEIQNEIHRIIFDELCIGQCSMDSKQYYIEVIQQLQQQGAEAVILGCTEIGLLIQQQDADIPFLDTTLLHSQAAAQFILGK